ncbi:hypothetical protein SVAN01_07534 [Stagonosporopsis vannaccii]|nr:hypothetical protein SVAN01_07534 [Stagonosporopsis vannaccii]
MRRGAWERSEVRQHADWLAREEEEDRRSRLDKEKEYIRLRGEQKAWVKRGRARTKGAGKARFEAFGGKKGQVNDVEWRDERRSFEDGSVEWERRVRLL